MAAPEDAAEAIEQAATGPRRVQVGSESVESHPIPDLIEADRYLSAKTAAGRNHHGITFTKLVPPGGG